MTLTHVLSCAIKQQRERSTAAGAVAAGFGGTKRTPNPKETPPSLTTGEAVARTMLKEYNILRKAGGEVARVYARLKGTERWYPVGHVRIFSLDLQGLVELQ